MCLEKIEWLNVGKMRKLEHICVFCGSKEGNDQVIIDVATELGYALADHDITLVYGAAKNWNYGISSKSHIV
jgi:predicted Rossmann-fold nucleotide-binding protein